VKGRPRRTRLETEEHFRRSQEDSGSDDGDDGDVTAAGDSGPNTKMDGSPPHDGEIQHSSSKNTIDSKRMSNLTSVHRKLPPFCYNAEIIRMMSSLHRADYFATISANKSDTFIPFLNKADTKFKYPAYRRRRG
jgi:hypothetical protein